MAAVNIPIIPRKSKVISILIYSSSRRKFPHTVFFQKTQTAPPSHHHSPQQLSHKINHVPHENQVTTREIQGNRTRRVHLPSNSHGGSREYCIKIGQPRCFWMNLYTNPNVYFENFDCWCSFWMHPFLQGFFIATLNCSSRCIWT